MNAYELADLIECACCAYQKEAGAMLRQQQAKIDALKQSKFDANNKVNLTDEEILEVIKERETPSYMNFARAILKKASEK